MNTEPKKDPSARLRSVLGNQSALSHLPKKRSDSTDFLPEQEVRKESPVKKEDANQRLRREFRQEVILRFPTYRIMLILPKV